jgi:hypothetical protein
VRQVMKVGIAHPSWLQDQVRPHVFGELPRCKPLAAQAPAQRSRG